MNRRNIAQVGAVALALTALLVGCTTTASETAESAPPAESVVESSSPEAEAAEGAQPEENATEADDSAVTESEAMLLYVMEEEKLAHDVYSAMYEEYGRSPFDNIMESEVTHQDTLVPILEARGLEDPRTGVEGEFTNPELQSLYDELVAKGLQSWEDAIEVGVQIEESDITDLQEAIAGETDPDTIQAYEFLLSGSENHLEAFQGRL